MLQRLQRSARSATLTATLMAIFAFAPSAQAIQYTGAWDPSFGSAFPDLGWRGEATFFVPDACLSQSGWVFNFDSCSSSGMQLVSAEVEFYKFSDPTNTTFQETLSFDVSSPFVLAMKLDNGLLTGVLGTFNYFMPSTLPIAGGPYTDFVLLFENDIARMGTSPIRQKEQDGRIQRPESGGRHPIHHLPGCSGTGKSALVAAWNRRHGLDCAAAPYYCLAA